MKTQSNQPRAAGEAAHTPTPWAAQSCQAPDGLGNAISIGPEHSGEVAIVVPHDDMDANAAFIVRACNSHAALVEALERALSFIEAQEYSSGLKSEAGDQARAALQLAKEGQK